MMQHMQVTIPISTVEMLGASLVQTLYKRRAELILCRLSVKISPRY
jgi:hypothetical protein